MKHVLITGVAGLLGSRLAEYLLYEKNCEVIGIDACEEWGNTPDNLAGSNTNGKLEGLLLHPRFKFYRFNLESETKVKSLFEQHSFDVVYHFAAYAAEGLSPFLRKFNYMNNIIPTANIINACIEHDVQRLVFTSSMSVYGDQEDGILTEDSPTIPMDPYGVAKLACEQDIRIAGLQHGLEWCIVRPHNVFGRNQNLNDRYRNVLGIWMHQIVQREPITIYGSGNQIRVFTDMENLLEPLYLAGTSPACADQVINLGGKVPITIGEAANKLCSLTGYKDVVHLEPRFEAPVVIPSTEKSEVLLNYKDLHTFDESLEAMWKWASTCDRIGEWYKWDNFELTRKMYSYWVWDS